MVSQPTVAERQGSSKHAFADEAEPRGRRGLFGWLRGRQGDAAEPEPFFTQPAPTPRPAQSPAAPPAAVHRDHATDPDDIAVNLIGISAWGLKNKVSSTVLRAELTACWAELTGRADAERAAVETVARRNERDAAETARMAKAMEYADSLGALDHVGPDRLAATMVSRSVHASDPSQPTGLLPVITPDMPDPRGAVELERSETDPMVFTVTAGGAPSPVHPDDDGTTPPMPDEAPGATAPLPHRVTAEPESAASGAVDPEPTGVIASRKTGKPAGGGAR